MSMAPLLFEMDGNGITRLEQIKNYVAAVISLSTAVHTKKWQSSAKIITIHQQSGPANTGKHILTKGKRHVVFESRPHHRAARLQPLAHSAGRALRPSLHRRGLCLQRLQPADEQADWRHRIDTRRLEADRYRLD